MCWCEEIPRYVRESVALWIEARVPYTSPVKSQHLKRVVAALLADRAGRGALTGSHHEREPDEA